MVIFKSQILCLFQNFSKKYFRRTAQESDIQAGDKRAKRDWSGHDVLAASGSRRARRGRAYGSGTAGDEHKPHRRVRLFPSGRAHSEPARQHSRRRVHYRHRHGFADARQCGLQSSRLRQGQAHLVRRQCVHGRPHCSRTLHRHHSEGKI